MNARVRKGMVARIINMAASIDGDRLLLDETVGKIKKIQKLLDTYHFNKKQRTKILTALQRACGRCEQNFPKTDVTNELLDMIETLKTQLTSASTSRTNTKSIRPYRLVEINGKYGVLLKQVGSSVTVICFGDRVIDEEEATCDRSDVVLVKDRKTVLLYLVSYVGKNPVAVISVAHRYACMSLFVETMRKLNRSFSLDQIKAAEVMCSTRRSFFYEAGTAFLDAYRNVYGL